MSVPGNLPPQWTDLFTTDVQIAQGPLRYSLGNVDAAIVNAVRSGQVPVRGWNSHGAFERLDERNVSGAIVDVLLSKVTLDGVAYTHVEAGIGELQRYLRDNLATAPISHESAEQTTLRSYIRSRTREPDPPTRDALLEEIRSQRAELFPMCDSNFPSERMFRMAWADEASSDSKLPGRRRRPRR
jgi:hypothetical protein